MRSTFENWDAVDTDKVQGLDVADIAHTVNVLDGEARDVQPPCLVADILDSANDQLENDEAAPICVFKTADGRMFYGRAKMVLREIDADTYASYASEGNPPESD